MQKMVSAASLIFSFLVIDWLTFHDWREPHTVRDYLTLAASLATIAYLAIDFIQARRSSAQGDGWS